MTTVPENISPEQRFVLCCASVEMTDSRISGLVELAEKNLDWEKVFDTAKRHGVLFFLYKGLKAAQSRRPFHSSSAFPFSALPDGFFEKLKTIYLQTTARNLVLSSRLAGVIQLLAAAGVKAVPFKGPVLAESVYGDIGFRRFSDLDILVSAEDAVKARDVLVDNGFYLGTEIPEQQLRTYIRYENFFGFHDESGSVQIDLHWEITGRYSLCPIFLEDLCERLEKVALVNGELLALGFEDKLIYLCIHSSSHNWEKLELICSVAEIVKSGRITDWPGLIERAGRFKCRKMVLLGLTLARDFLDVELPEYIQREINRARFLNRLERQVARKIFLGEMGFSEKLSWRFSSFHFFVRDSFFDGIRYWLRIFFRPTIREWINTPLPAGLLFFYHVLRPFRIVRDTVLSLFPKNSLISATFSQTCFFYAKK